jgi:hypothetical protein
MVGKGKIVICNRHGKKKIIEKKRINSIAKEFDNEQELKKTHS